MKRLCAAEQSMASYGFLALNRVQLYYSASWTVYVLDQKALKSVKAGDKWSTFVIPKILFHGWTSFENFKILYNIQFE